MSGVHQGFTQVLEIDALATAVGLAPVTKEGDTQRPVESRRDPRRGRYRSRRRHALAKQGQVIVELCDVGVPRSVPAPYAHRSRRLTGHAMEVGSGGRTLLPESCQC
ncbi:hypothetical protein HRUBRA_00552 [Pseudohaliea rubra DSM 19751]|uniref:Uncharacterized protein n=1 Tax=Pseudohaliea rubra DSM 19751 TaxID=1265313 RepID=A0A095X1Q2_9GAMM|nr:hypothetical protein HRUBRA_00552 [Pseudohaliea rubra DSM 19751]